MDPRYWYYWEDLIGEFILVDNELPLNRVVGTVASKTDAIAWVEEGS